MKEPEFGGTHPAAATSKPVFRQVVFDGSDRARKCRDDEKRCASIEARWNAASPMPMTGPIAALRAASRPVSSKQAMMCAETPSRP